MDQQSEFSVIFYEKEDGSMPARDFILGLDEKLKAKTLRNIGIFEIRTKVVTNLTRVLYFFYVSKKGCINQWFY